MKHIKLIWDFRGSVSQKTAEHHLVHLKEYIALENLKVNITGVETLNEMHSIAYMVLNKDDMITVRDALKPHRGVLYESKQ